MKRLLLVAALLAATITHALSAGTISFSLSQQFDSQGKPLSGGKLYFFEAGTSTPQTAYSDAALTIALPNPVTLDASGRVPQFFLADGNIKIRLDDKTGVTVIAADNILVIGPSSGGGGGGDSVDATTILATGDFKLRYGTGALTGFVRSNGRTIGSATSGATERANADTQALFLYLWAADPNLAVSGGRGGDAASDWAANKTIATPDYRGRVIAGMDGMGNVTTDRITTGISGIDGATLGASGGGQSTSIQLANLPNYNLSVGSITASFTGSNLTIPALDVGNDGGQAAHFLSRQQTGYDGDTGGLGWIGSVSNVSTGLNTEIFSQHANTIAKSNVSGVAGTVTMGGFVPSGGSGTALSIMPPTLVITVYLKL